ncbi:MAG: DnaJ domain-containing protein [Spirulinaceae cyanobacterium]
MPQLNYYQILEVDPKVTQREIKQAYRHLVKRFHPDTHRDTANHGQIVLLNCAYEVLSDPQRRRSYDRQLFSPHRDASFVSRQQRTSQAQERYRRQYKTGREQDTHLYKWFQEVYQPVNQLISIILNSLEAEIEYLSADPFDDELMAAFQDYLEDCRLQLKCAQQLFTSQPNPTKVAGTATNLYYCLNQLGDGIEELRMFTLNYDEYYLNTGRELFRIATGFYGEAQELANI